MVLCWGHRSWVSELKGGRGNDKKDNGSFDHDDDNYHDDDDDDDDDDDHDANDDDDDNDDDGDKPVVGCLTEGLGVEAVELRRWDSCRW